MTDLAISHRTTAQDSNRMPRPVRVPFVRSAPCQCFCVNSVFPEGRLLLQVLFYEPVSSATNLWTSALRQTAAGGNQCRGRRPLGVQELLYGNDVSYSCFVPVYT